MISHQMLLSIYYEHRSILLFSFELYRHLKIHQFAITFDVFERWSDQLKLMKFSDIDSEEIMWT